MVCIIIARRVALRAILNALLLLTTILTAFAVRIFYDGNQSYVVMCVFIAIV